jgi:hypothetical protein
VLIILAVVFGSIGGLVATGLWVAAIAALVALVVADGTLDHLSTI